MPGGFHPRKAAVLGLGLIGGSIAAALRATGWEVTGFSRRPEARQYALERGIVDAVTEPLPAVAGAELVILAGPPGSLPEMARECAPGLAAGALVTDVASVKGQVLAQVPACLPPGVDFVGGHPMAGSEQRGVEASSPLLLQGAPYLLTWQEEVSWDAMLRLVAVVRSLGCTPFLLSAEEHDRLLAGISHAPHLTAAALALLAAGDGGQDLAAASRLAAGGFRDTTRVASGDPALWRDISQANREHLVAALERLQSLLSQFRLCLARGEARKLEAFLTQAQWYREKIINSRPR